jgi:hypothetical protein
MSKLLVYVEFDQPFCGNVYGSSPCTAAVGVTGAAKCFNSVLSCQDRVNYVDAPVTLRFAQSGAQYLPSSIEAIPSVTNWSVSPSIISLGEDLGLRAELRVSLKDHPWPDTGPGGDPYVDERSYDPFKQGTYWGKWRARVRFMRGRSIRLIKGHLGQSLDEMETRHFVIEHIDGPNADGSVTIIAKDPLKLADGDRAQCPVASRGYLQAEITNSETTATLAPSGIGVEYPSSGYVAIAGSEICSFTRSGDVLTIVRAQYGTEARAHAAEDSVQLCKEYIGQDAADIIADQFENFAHIDPAYIPITDWQAETAAYSGRVFSTLIAQPTDVAKLVSELIQQAALSIWWDEIERKIRLRTLRPIATDAEIFGPDTMLHGSFRSREQADKRVSQVWLWFGQRNPLKPVDDQENYRSVAVIADADAEADYGVPAIKKIFSRWIAAFGRSSAERTCALILGRYRDPPRRFNFSLFEAQAANVFAGQGYQVNFWNLQNDEGETEPVPIQITRFAPKAGEVEIEAEEANYTRLDPVDLQNRTITIDTNTTNFNLRMAHDLLYPAPQSGDDFTLTIIVQTGAIVGGSVLGQPSFHVGDWTGFNAVTISIIVNGRVQGRGGKGGDGHTTNMPIDGGAVGQPGEAGSTAIYSRRAVFVENNGQILGGGGGGGAGGRSTWASNRESGGGGGGQGYIPGSGGVTFDGTRNFRASTPGTTDVAGIGGWGANGAKNRGGNGGLAGQPGTAGLSAGADPGKAGGAAGLAIDGVSYLTISGPGTITGGQAN